MRKLLTKRNWLVALVIVLVIAVVAGLVVWANSGEAEAKDERKVTICHATGSETNPFTRIVVDEHAIGAHFDRDRKPKTGHEGDLLLKGVQECPQPELCEWNDQILASDEACFEPCEFNEAIPADDEACFEPCEYNSSIPADDAECVEPVVNPVVIPVEEDPAVTEPVTQPTTLPVTGL